MKNKHVSILIWITCVFAAFTLGFLTGRLNGTGDVQISAISSPVKVQEIESDSVPSTFPAESQGAMIANNVTESPTETIENSGLININSATREQLDSLPGIGPVLAQRIIDYRSEHGPFTDVSQLLLVPGIGEKRLASILDLITVK